MPTYRYPHIDATEITPEEIWLSRRDWMKAAGATLASGALGVWPGTGLAATLAALPATRNPSYVVMDPATPEKDVISYNNYYEFGMDKGDPFLYAKTLQTEPWS